MDNNKPIKVLFICMGNICRSPSAEGVFRDLINNNHLQNEFSIESAGTHAYHMDEAPDLRSQKAAKDRGIDLSSQRARKVIMGDFEDFDYLLAMDNENLAILMQSCPAEHKHKVGLFLDYAPHLKTNEVPDPYYGGKYGFETVLDLIEEASTGFFAALQSSGKIK